MIHLLGINSLNWQFNLTELLSEIEVSRRRKLLNVGFVLSFKRGDHKALCEYRQLKPL